MGGFDPQWWEHHYQIHAAKDALPSVQLVDEATGLPAGSALDAGCGRGADALWLAGQGWQVTAVDVSPAAVEDAETRAAELDPEIASRISWVVADPATWQPPQRYDLVVTQYGHGEYVARLAEAVAARGTLLVVGHEHADALDVEAITGALDPDLWTVDVAESRLRHIEHGTTRMVINDLVVRANRQE